MERFHNPKCYEIQICILSWGNDMNSYKTKTAVFLTTMLMLFDIALASAGMNEIETIVRKAGISGGLIVDLGRMRGLIRKTCVSTRTLLCRNWIQIKRKWSGRKR